MNPELAVFAYPWDFASQGVDAVVGEIADVGANRLMIAAAYHSIETITPRARGAVHITPEANVAHVPVALGRFGTITPRPGRLATERPDLFADIAESSASRSLSMSAWTIGLHNSALAQQHPGSAIVNCFGDVSAHYLCPAAPDSAEYVTSLCDGIARTGYFDEIFLESLSYGLVGHGHPHELWAVRLDSLQRWLLSLCFCDSCIRRAGAGNIDVLRLRGWVRDYLHASWNTQTYYDQAPEDDFAAAAELLSNEELYRFSRMRCDVITELGGRIRDVIHVSNVRLNMASAVWVRPPSMNWMEGIDLVRLHDVADRIAIMPYHAKAADVARDIAFALRQISTDRLQVLQTVWTGQQPDGSALQRKLHVAMKAGIASFGIYNFAAAPAAALDTIRELAAQLRVGPVGGAALKANAGAEGWGT